MCTFFEGHDQNGPESNLAAIRGIASDPPQNFTKQKNFKAHARLVWQLLVGRQIPLVWFTKAHTASKLMLNLLSLQGWLSLKLFLHDGTIDESVFPRLMPSTALTRRAAQALSRNMGRKRPTSGRFPWPVQEWKKIRTSNGSTMRCGTRLSATGWRSSRTWRKWHMRPEIHRK